MDEEKKAEKAIEKKAEPDTETGDKPKAASIVEQANTASERMEEANKKREELIREEQELDAKKVLSGTATVEPKTEKKELTDVEYKDAVMRGEIPDK